MHKFVYRGASLLLLWIVHSEAYYFRIAILNPELKSLNLVY